VALSYVWGSVESEKTTIEDLEFMQVEDVFSFLLHTPKVIEEVIGLVPKLGLRYLWVDRFCIVQDDTSNKHIQIGNMGSIYANAYVTIVLAQGRNANDGLVGLAGLTPPRDLNKATAKLPPDQNPSIRVSRIPGLHMTK
jgi:hypothetical protein